MLDIHGTVDGICYLGMTSAKIFQYCTVAFQMAILGWFLIALGKEAASADNPAGPMPDISWFDPTRINSFSAFSAGLAVSIFVYWGWATVPTPGEETKVSRGPTSTESTAASILLILLVVVFVRHSSGDALHRRARRHRKQSWKSGHSRERVHGSRPPSDGSSRDLSFLRHPPRRNGINKLHSDLTRTQAAGLQKMRCILAWRTLSTYSNPSRTRVTRLDHLGPHSTRTRTPMKTSEVALLGQLDRTRCWAPTCREHFLK